MSLRSFLLGFAAGALLVAAPRPAGATPTVTVVTLARQGMPAPDGNGTFSSYFDYTDPVLNNAGQAAFTGRFAGTALGGADDDYLVRAGITGSPEQLARQNQALPDVTGTFGNLISFPRAYAMNDSGRVAFVTARLGTPGGSADNSAIYSVKDPGLFWVHARRGDTPPFTATTFNGLFPPTINDQPPGAVSFFTSHGGSPAPVTVYTSRLGALSPVAWLSRLAPDESEGDGINGALSIFSFAGTGDPPALRPNASEIAFYSHLSGTTNASLDDDGIFRASPDAFVDCARGNQSAPGGGTYQEFQGSPVYNANGVAGIVSLLKPVPSAGVVITLDWPGGGDLAAYSGQGAADGNGIMSSFSPPALNNHEAVAYRVVFSGTTLGGLDDEAIYKGDSSLVVVPELEDQIARENQPVPEGGGSFGSFGTLPAINDAGQIAFVAALRFTPLGGSDDAGLYLWDPTEGLVKLLRKNDVIDGRHVSNFSALVSRDFGGWRSLSQNGEVVARVDFVEPGGDGVYLFRLDATVSAPPIPPTVGRLSLRIGPNPVARGGLTVNWYDPDAASHAARVEVLDPAGRRIRVLHDGPAAAGTTRWDLADDDGHRVASGIYIVRIEAGGEVRARRVAVTR